MRESANYRFNLPERADQFNLDHWNQNTEKLDEKLKSIDDLTNNDLKTSLLNFIYPVGSLYWSSNPTNPGTLFGGTWSQIKDKFVLACGDTYANGATGGNANTILGVANLPSHTHGLNNHTHGFTPSGAVSAHNHGLNNHTHSFTPSGTVSAHSHGLNSHTHGFTPAGTVSAHNHGLNSHTHSFTPSGTVSAHSHGVGSLATISTGGHNHNLRSTDRYDTYCKGLTGEDGDLVGGLNSKHGGSIAYVNKSLVSQVNDHSHPITGSTANTQPTFTGKAGTTGQASGNTGNTTPTFTGKAGTTGAASGNTANATPTFTGTAGTTGAASGNTTATGSGTAFSNMPPYVVKYCWERTA